MSRPRACRKVLRECIPGVATMLLVSCGDPIGPDSFPCLDSPMSVADPYEDGGRDAVSARIALELPGGFAGVYVGRPGEPGAAGYLTFQLAKPEEAEEALPLLRLRLAGEGMLGGASGFATSVAYPVEYDFAQLYACGVRARALPIPGLVSFDLDELANRIQIGILDGSDEPRLRDRMRRAQIPQAIVSIDQEDPPLADSRH